MAEHESEGAQPCPLAGVDKRLEDAHRLWHQAEETTFRYSRFRSNVMMHSNAVNVNVRGICYRPNRPYLFSQERRGGRRPAERGRAATESALIRPNRAIAPLYHKNGRAQMQ